jgi:hypothetical protein
MPALTVTQRNAALVDQGEFDFLMPFGERRKLLAPREVAECIGRSVDFVYAECECGRFEAHGPLDREKTRIMITRRSVLLWLAETAQTDPRYFMERVEKMMATLSVPQLNRLIEVAGKLRAKL